MVERWGRNFTSRATSLGSMRDGDHPGVIDVILHRVHELVASTSAKATCQEF